MPPNVTVTVGNKRMDLLKAGPGTATHTLGSGAEDKRPLNIQARDQQTLYLNCVLLQAIDFTQGRTWGPRALRDSGDLSPALFVVLLASMGLQAVHA